MAKLTPKQTEYFRSMELMFEGAGWSILAQGWKGEQGELPERVFFNAKDMDTFVEARIRFELLAELLALPEQIEAQKQHILDSEEEPDE